jgi:hypothetical protein
LIFKNDGLGTASQYPKYLFLRKGCGEDYDFRLRYRPNIADQFNSIPIGQVHINYEQLRPILLNRQHCPVGASAGRRYQKIGALHDDLAQVREHDPIIVDEDYAAAGAAGRCIAYSWDRPAACSEPCLLDVTSSAWSTMPGRPHAAPPNTDSAKRSLSAVSPDNRVAPRCR